ncbi:MAG TPA: cation transporter [Niabella sp.]
MDILQFKTNLKCEGCVSKITPALNELQGVDSWSVDLKVPERTLTVSGEALDEKAVTKALQENGYKAEKIGQGV